LTSATIDQPKEAAPKKSRDAKKFLQHAAIYGLGAVSVQLVGIVLMPLYTRKFTTEEYGVLVTLYRIGEILNICLMMNGIRQATFNFWGKAKHNDEKRHLPATVALFTVIVLVGGTGFAILGADVLAAKLHIEDSRLLACGIIAMLLQASTVMPMALMQARMESTWFVCSSLLILFCQLSLVIFSVLVLDMREWGVVMAMIITYGFFGLVLTTRELAKSPLMPDAKQLWEITKFAAPFIPTGLCFFVLHSGDHFFLWQYCGAAVAGVYGLGYRIAKGVVMLSFQPFFQVWTAWMYDVYKKPGREIAFGQAYSRILSSLLLAGLGIVVFQDEVLAVLGSPAFAASASVIAPLVLAHVFLTLATLIDSGFYVKRRTDIKPWVAAATTVVMLLAYYILIPAWGSQGAAWATLIGFMFYCGLNLIVAHRVFPAVIEYRRLITMVSMAVSIGLCSRWLGLSVPAFFAKCVLFVFFPLGVWYWVADSDEKEFARHGLNKTLHWCHVSRPRRPTEMMH
jgi:O-antigen/teichoic acid export membrane protein